MKPLMMMKKPGLSGPTLARHAGGFKGLSKSVGNSFIEALEGVIACPSLIGMDAATAASTLTTAGLVGDQQGTIGTVDVQAPPPSTLVKVGSVVVYHMTG